MVLAALRSMLPLVAALTALPVAAHAQLELAHPATPASALAPVVNPPAWRAPPRHLFFSLRVSLGAAVALGLNAGSAFAYGLSTGARWTIPVGGDRAWVLGADVGVDRTAGFGERAATLLSAGVTPGFAWASLGLAWAPRALFAVTDTGETAWGVRNGARLLVAAGVLDLELAHQYLAGPFVVNHQFTLTLGLDPGLVVHVLSQHRGRW